MAPNAVADDGQAMQAAEPLAGRPPVRNKLFGVCLFILIVEMTERLCFYTIYPTFPQYLTKAGKGGNGLQSGPANALKQSFRMLAYLFPLVGGYMADNILGRYRTILYFTLCYVIGTALIAVGAVGGLMTSGVGLPIFLFGAFVFTAVGTGAIKPNVVNFGAEQYDANDPEEADQQKAFFSYFYMVINIGGIFAQVWLAGLATSEVTSEGPGQGFFYAYLAAAVAMILSLLAFLAGTGRYSPESKASATRKPMVSIVRRHITEGASRSIRGKISILGMILLPIYLFISLLGSLLPSSVHLPVFFQMGDSPGMSLLDLIAFILACVSCGMIIWAHVNNDWIAPLSSGGGSGINTDEVRGMMRALPTIICVSIGFNLCYGGMDIYQLQACQMDTRTGLPQSVNDVFFLKTGQFNGVFYSLGDNASIIICIPLLEMWIFPALKRMRGGVGISRMTKFNVGFFFAILGCGVGIALEVIRRKADLITCTPDQAFGECFCATGFGKDFKPVVNATDPDKGLLEVTYSECVGRPEGQWLLVSNCAPTGVPMSDLTAWWTFIPYWITGMGEILVNPVIQEFSFDEVSPNLKSLLMGITMVVTGCIPSVISGALGGFIPNNLNLGDVNIVFIVFIVLSLVLLAIQWMIALPEKTGQELRDEAATA